MKTVDRVLLNDLFEEGGRDIFYQDKIKRSQNITEIFFSFFELKIYFLHSKFQNQLKHINILYFKIDFLRQF